MKNSSKKMFALVMIVIALICLPFLRAERLAENPETFIDSAKKKPGDPILLEKVEAGYKFYTPCINYSGQRAKNEGC